MSNLTQILELLLAEDNEKAEEMLHEYVVAKARAEYERVLDESEDEEVDEEVDEAYDMTDDFESDILDDEDEIDADEIGEEEEDFDDELGGDEFGGDDMEMGADEFGGDDMEMGDEEFDDEGEDDIEDKVDSLEAELEDLRAEFEQLMAGDDEEGDDFDVDADAEGDVDFDAEGEDDVDFDDEEGEDEEVMDSVEYDLDEEFDDDDDVVEEATQFSKTNIKPDMSGDPDSANGKSPYTQAPKPSVQTKAKPVRSNDGSEGKKGGEKKDHTPTNNIEVDHKKGPTAKDGKTDVDGSGKTSPFTKKPK